MSALGAPTARVFPASVWTGSRFLVWGGLDGARFAGDGAAYDPVADAWEPMATGGPSARWKAAAVWTGTRMIVWGGDANDPFQTQTGGSYVSVRTDDRRSLRVDERARRTRAGDRAGPRAHQ